MNVPNADNQVYEIKVPTNDTDGKTVWLRVGTLTLLASKGHAQGLLRLNMIPNVQYHAFLRQESNSDERG
jgi:hypothetical protein